MITEENNFKAFSVYDVEQPTSDFNKDFYNVVHLIFKLLINFSFV